MKPKLYLETTIPSYLTARPTRDPLMVGKLAATKKWWRLRQNDFELFVSQLVLDEARAEMPVPQAAAQRSFHDFRCSPSQRRRLNWR